MFACLTVWLLNVLYDKVLSNPCCCRAAQCCPMELTSLSHPPIRDQWWRYSVTLTLSMIHAASLTPVLGMLDSLMETMETVLRYWQILYNSIHYNTALCMCINIALVSLTANSMTCYQDFKCGITPDSSASNQCASDPRISVIRSSNMCGLRISNPQPDDVGVWRVYVNELKTNGQYENNQKVRNSLETRQFSKPDNFQD